MEKWETGREIRQSATGNSRMTIVNCLNKIYECPNVSPYNFMHFNIKFITICVRIFLWLLPSTTPRHLNSLCGQPVSLTICIPCAYECGKSIGVLWSWNDI